MDDYPHQEEAISAARATVRSNKGFVDSIRRLNPCTASELVAELVTSIWHSWLKGNFDPKRGSFSTWATMVAWGELKDMAKSADGHYRKKMLLIDGIRSGEDRIDEVMPIEVILPQNAKFAKVVAHQQKKLKIPDKLSKGPNELSFQHYAAAREYGIKNGLSIERLWVRMRGKEQLYKIFGFDECPSLSALYKSLSRARRWSGVTVRRRRGKPQEPVAVRQKDTGKSPEPLKTPAKTPKAAKCNALNGS